MLAEQLRRRPHRRCAPRAGELLEVERVAAALLVERGRVATSTASPRSSRASSGVRAPSSRRVSAPARCARSSAADEPLRQLPRANATAGARLPPGAAKQRAEQLDGARSRPSGSRRAGARGASSPRAVRAARGQRGECGIARAGARRRAQTKADERREDLRELRSQRRRPSASRRRGSRPSTYSSSASTKTQNGRSRSSSEAEPASTRCPRSSARAASSARRRVLPIPGSPTSSIAPASPRSSSSSELIERAELVGTPDEVLGSSTTLSLWHEDRSGVRRKIRVRDQGRALMSPELARRQARPSVPFPAPPQSRATGVGVIFAALRAPEPASSSGDAGLVPFRRPRDLVERWTPASERGCAYAATVVRH